MSKQTEALKLALEAICGSGDFLFNWHDCEPNNEREMQRYQATLAANENAFRAIREALAEQPAQQQEPDLSHLRKETQEAVRGWIKDGTFFDRAIGTMHDQEKLLMAYEKAQQQEPVAWATQMGEYAHIHWGAKRPEYPMVYEVPFYTSPPASKPWVGLTDEEAEDIWNRYCDEMGEASINDALDIAQAIESALRSKNT